MDTSKNHYISLSYQLFSVEDDGKKHLLEQTRQGEPDTFISGFGVYLDALEEAVLGLAPGERFDVTLTPAQGFGDYDDSLVHKVSRETFTVNGRFDVEHIFPGAFITVLFGEEGRRQMAQVVSIEDDGVTLDANHPFAGYTLNFQGMVLENREASIAEIQQLLQQLSGGGCGGGCEGCGGGCGDDDCGEEGCGGGGCGHCGK